VTTGKLWYQNHDIQLSGPQGLRFSRWYDNQSSYSRDLGYGWRHNYNAHLDLSTGGRIIFVDEEGRKVFFNGLGAGSSVHDEITGADLALDNPATTYTLTLWKNARMRFDLGGNLTSVTDRIGNTQTVGRDAGNANRITSVTDTLGRSIAFGYDSQNRITSITSNPCSMRNGKLVLYHHARRQDVDLRVRG
jgi:YD repeat-containing protein